MSRFHVVISRNSAFRFAAEWNSALGSKSKVIRPFNNRLRAGLDSNLIKPGIARFGQGLDEIQRASVSFFPVVKSDIPNLDTGDAFVEIVRRDRAAFESGDSYGDLKG